MRRWLVLTLVEQKKRSEYCARTKRRRTEWWHVQYVIDGNFSVFGFRWEFMGKSRDLNECLEGKPQKIFCFYGWNNFGFFFIYFWYDIFEDFEEIFFVLELKFWNQPRLVHVKELWHQKLQSFPVNSTNLIYNSVY